MNPYDALQSRTGEVSPGRFSLKRKVRSKEVLAGMFAIFLVSFFWRGMTSCACGHTDLLTSIVLVPAFVGSVLLLGFLRRCRPPHRVVVVFFAVLVGLMFVGNVADILWLGHQPLVGRRGDPQRHLGAIRQNLTCSLPAYQVGSAKCLGISGVGDAHPHRRIARV
jgi:hypothetical protein